MGRQLLNVLIPFITFFQRRSFSTIAAMQYVQYEKGGTENLKIGQTNIPELRDREVLMKVYSSAINRADCLQRMGRYPPPPGESEILGLEAAGTVDKLGPGCKGSWKIGDRVMALLSGGGYAEYVAVPEDLLMPVSAIMQFNQAAAIPEVWLTAYQLLHVAGELQAGETVLIHAGGSGVGTAAVQLALLKGARPIVTAGSDAKIETAKKLGAVTGFNYKKGDFSEKVLQFTGGKGVDLILDCIGESFYEQNMKSIRVEGRWVLYGLLGGGNVNSDIFSQMLMKRIRITGTTLRSRSVEYKKAVVDGFMSSALPLFESGKLKTIVDSVYPFHKASDAHKHMESNQNTGKIVLQIRDEESGKPLNREEL